MTKVLVGTPAYLAPEVIQNYIYSKKSDIYSFGVLVWRVVCEEQPWGELSSLYDIFECVAGGKRPGSFLFLFLYCICFCLLFCFLISFPISSVTQKKIPKTYQKLIEDCWRNSPKNRPSFLEILDTLAAISEKDEMK